MILLAVLSLGVVTAAAASRRPTLARLDPYLRLAAARGQLGPALTSLSSAVEVDRRPGVEVVLTAERDIRPALEALGAHVRTVLDADRPVIITADVPYAALAGLDRLPGLIAAHAARRTHRQLDVSVLATGAPHAWIGSDGDGWPVTGAGVVVGVVDSGIDYRHPVFRDAEGTLRVAGIWDQNLSGGEPPPGYDYGVWCDQESLGAGRCAHTDADGHGTHVASIAAGRNPAGRFTGMAPDAWLLVVADDGDDASIIDGWSFLVDVAAASNRPIVINNSFGVHDGPHDGTAPLERAIRPALGAARRGIRRVGRQ